MRKLLVIIFYFSHLLGLSAQHHMMSVLSTSTSTSTPPIAYFSASNTSPVVDESITFTDMSSNSPTSWSWAFTGATPSTSTLENPSVTYSSAGTYTVSLTATNADGSDIEEKIDYITVTSSSSSLLQNLISVYELDETSGTTAIDANGNYDGTNTGATINQSGKINQAYDFASGDYISAAGAIWADEADRSVSIWFKLDNITADHALFSNWSTGASSSGQFIIQFDSYSGKTGTSAVVDYVLMTSTGATAGLWCETSATFGAGTWYHIVFVHEWGVDVNIYVNGVLSNNNSNASQVISENTGSVRIGYPLSNSKDMDGLIDQVATWSKALTEIEVLTLYNSGSGKASLIGN